MLQVGARDLRILPGQGDEWHLTVPFLISGRFGRYTVDIELDRAMLPLPQEATSVEELSLGLSGIGFGVPIKGMWVDTEARRISFIMAWLDSSFKAATDTAQKTIAFRWARPSQIPLQTCIRIEIKNFLGQIQQSHLIFGQNVSLASLVEIVPSRPPENTFYFSQNGLVPSITCWDVCRIGGLLQNFIDSASWAFTGPGDVDFWESDDGVELLARQFIRVTMSAGQFRSVRISLCPYALGCSGELTRRLLVSLAVQNGCGIEIYVVTPEQAATTFGDTDTVGGGFGSGFAAEWKWSNTNKAEIYLERARVDFLEEQYHELVSNSYSWREFLNERGVVFSPAEKLEVRRRAAAIRGKAALLQQPTMIVGTAD